MFWSVFSKQNTRWWWYPRNKYTSMSRVHHKLCWLIIRRAHSVWVTFVIIHCKCTSCYIPFSLLYSNRVSTFKLLSNDFVSSNSKDQDSNLTCNFESDQVLINFFNFWWHNFFSSGLRYFFSNLFLIRGRIYLTFYTEPADALSRTSQRGVTRCPQCERKPGKPEEEAYGFAPAEIDGVERSVAEIVEGEAARAPNSPSSGFFSFLTHPVVPWTLLPFFQASSDLDEPGVAWSYQNSDIARGPRGWRCALKPVAQDRRCFLTLLWNAVTLKRTQMLRSI